MSKRDGLEKTGKVYLVWASAQFCQPRVVRVVSSRKAYNAYVKNASTSYYYWWEKVEVFGLSE